MSARRSPGCWRSMWPACDRAGLAGAVKLAQRVRGWVDAVDVAIARRSRELAAEGRSESAAEVLTGYGRRSTRETKAASDRSEVCEQMPGFETALAAGAVSASHVDAVANASKGLDDAGRERLGELAGRVVGVRPGRAGRRCSSVAAGCSANASPVTRASPNWTSRRRRCRCDAGSTSRPGCTTPTSALDPERDAKLWSAIDAQLASIKQADGNSGTPIDQSAGRRGRRRRCLGNGPGSGGCRRSVSTSTTPRCSTACMSIRCVRPPTGSRCHPRRCAVWRARRRSCRSCSTAPAKR